MTEWGWTTYKRTGWVTESGKRIYIGYFRMDHDPLNLTITRVAFAAKHPIAALRTIAASDDPLEFNDREVN